MKTPMTFQEWADSHRVPHELRAVVSDAWYAGQANAPQPTWRRWEDEKPSVGNNVGAIMVVLEFTEETGERLDCYSITVATNYPWHLPPLAWQYILPSGFAPKQKDEAEVAWDAFAKENNIPNDGTEEMKKQNCIYFFNLGRAKAKQ